MNFAHHTTIALIACMLATIIPVFFGRLGAAPNWLSLQALVLGWITLNAHHEFDLHVLAAGLEILIIRAGLAPHLLRRVLTGSHEAGRDVMPSNLFTWGVAVALIIVAFQFGDGARADTRALTLGVIAATVVIAFLVLATNRLPAAQLVALLFMENAMALFETLMPESWPLPVHLALSGLYLGTVAMGGWLVRGADTSSRSAVTPTESGL